MTTIAEINDFIIKHADAKYFEADVKLYKKHFPNSKLTPELEKAPEFAKKSLDERILSELLTNQDSCIDCIWENRGYIRDKGKLVEMASQKKAPAKTTEKKAADVKEDNKKIIRHNLLKIDLDKAKYNVLKQFVFDLGLQKECKDQKKATYLKVLKDFQSEMDFDTTGDVTLSEVEGKKKRSPNRVSRN